MINKKKIIALVPARGNSQGIKNKNLKKIKNKSLVELTLSFINNLKFIDYKILNSDSEKILKIGKKQKFLNITRPKNLSGPKVSDYQIIDYTLKQFEKNGLTADYLIYLQPTSPKRDKKHLVKVMKKVIKGKLDGAWSVTEIDKKYHPLKILIEKAGKLKLFLKSGKKITARQMLGEAYIRNGAFYIFSIKQFKSQKTIYLKNMILSKCNYQTVNIDNLKDLAFAKKII